MAFPVWRRGTRKVYVYYFDTASNTQMQLPRAATKHLDRLPEAEVEAWVREWEKAHGKASDRSDRIHLKDTDKLNTLWLQYQAHRDETRERRAITSESEDAIFRSHIVGYFVGERKAKLPHNWHPMMVDFHTHLFEKKLATSTTQKILWTLERFGKHLVWMQYMDYPFVVSLPVSKHAKVTPLKVRKAPEDILNLVKGGPEYKNKSIHFNLALLLGYFAGLGPGELFALSREDLLTGRDAETHCKTLLGFRKHKLGSKLGVVVNKTLPAKGKKNKPVPLMKNDFRTGVVNIWHPEAAKMIAAIVKDLPPGRLFPFSYGHLARMWRENVMPVAHITAHDLRRSSAHYLGRTLRIEMTLLQEHMRHAEMETTMLYIREPATPDTQIVARQDWDDVA